MTANKQTAHLQRAGAWANKLSDTVQLFSDIILYANAGHDLVNYETDKRDRFKCGLEVKRV